MAAHVVNLLKPFCEVIMSVVLKSATASTAPDLLTLRRDPVLAGDNGGVKFLFDLSFPYWWGGGAAVNGPVIRDVAGVGNGDFQLVSGQVVTFAGGGVDFNGLTAEPACVRGPSGCLSSIWAGNRYFMAAGHEKLPASGDWNTNASLAPSFCTSAAQAGYTTPEADLITVAQSIFSRMDARRQTNGATVVVPSNTALTSFYGRIVQWAAWRTATGTGFRMKSVLGTSLVIGETGAANVTDFSAQRPQSGVPDSFGNLAATTAHRLAAKRRLYRGWVEDLQIPGRTPATVPEADRTFISGLARYS